jgi:hypothetical protein
VLLLLSCINGDAPTPDVMASAFEIVRERAMEKMKKLLN